MVTLAARTQNTRACSTPAGRYVRASGSRRPKRAGVNCVLVAHSVGILTSQPSHARTHRRDHNKRAAHLQAVRAKALARAGGEHLLEGADLEVPPEVDDDNVRARREDGEHAEEGHKERDARGEEVVRHGREGREEGERVREDEGRYELASESVRARTYLPQGAVSGGVVAPPPADERLVRAGLVPLGVPLEVLLEVGEGE
jgi:hypothetical protein